MLWNFDLKSNLLKHKLKFSEWTKHANVDEMRLDKTQDHIKEGTNVSNIVCEVNTTVFFFYKYYKRLKRKIKTPQLTFIRTNQPKIHI